MTLSVRLCILAVAALLAGSGAPALARGQQAPTPAVVAAVAAPTPERAAANGRVFDRIWSEVRDDYYDPALHGVDWNAARETWRPRALAATSDRDLYIALQSMMRLLGDSHANVLSPAAARRQDEARKSRAVMGVTLAADGEGTWRVEQVRAGSPAEEAGILPGWLVADIDGAATSPDFDVIEGRAVRLGLADEAGVRREIAVSPRVMDPLPIFSAERPQAGVTVLKITAFQPGLGRWMGEQLAALPPGEAVVLDLRGNPGGRLAEAEAVLSCFLPRGRAWATRTSRAGRATTMRTNGRCGPLRGPAPNPLAVVVDQTSRSAAELTPAALQEAGRAVVVGRQTAGAVLISRETDLPDGGRMILSRADFVTAGGVRLEKRGVTPDIGLVTAYQDRRAGRDPALEGAVRAVLSRSSAAAKAA